MRIAIYGAGALGTVLGAYLSRAGEPVELVNRNRAHVDALNRNGAEIYGTLEMTVPVTAITPEEMGDGYDLIFLMTKQRHNPEIAEFLKPKLKEDGILCTTQNGMPEPKLAEILGDGRVLGCTVIWGATLGDPGRVKLTSDPDSMSFQIGSITGNEEANLRRVKTVLEKMCPVVVEKNFIGARWSKLLINATFSGLSVVTGMLFGEVAAQKDTRTVAQRVIKECIDVAKAAGIVIEPVQGHDIAKLMDYKGAVKKRIAYWVIPVAMKNHKEIRSGMLGDVERGRKCEIDAINGVVADYGRKYGAPTPFNDRIIEVVHGIEAGQYKPELENIRLFDNML